jgi:hypothetical protein
MTREDLASGSPLFTRTAGVRIAAREMDQDELQSRIEEVGTVPCRSADASA